MEKKNLRNNIVPCLLIFLMSLLPACFVQAQTEATSVNGRVTDSSGTPLSGVSVQNLNSHKGTFSDQSGKFSILATSGDVLQLSYIGFESQQVTYSGQTEIEVQLKSVAGTDLKDVVVIGYGTQNKEAVTGSVVSISGDKLREVPASNVSDALQGRLPGVEMAPTSSKPGAAMQIRIRGTRSLTATNDPLIVLDGIPFAGTVSDIDPNIITNVSILKDASATAIYGSRGANGVMLITTEKGKTGRPAQISYNSYVGAKKVFAEFPMMNGPEFVALRKAAGQFTNSLEENDSINTNWQDLLYRTGITTSHNINVTGGTEHGGYNFGVGYYQDQAVIPTQQFRRFSLHGSVDQEIGKYFKVGFSTNNNFSITDGSQVGLYGILSMSPIASPYNEDGTLKRTIKTQQDESWVYTRNSVEALKDKWLSRDKAYGSYNDLYAEVKIPGVEGLKYRVNLGLTYRQTNGGSYTGEGINSTNETTPSTASVSNSHTTDWIIENLLTYDRVFNGKHRLNFVGLYSTSQNTYNRSSMSAKDILSDDFQYYNLGQAAGEITVDPGGQDYQQSGLMSWMARAIYGYDDRYLLTATVRSDGSSRLAKGHQWHTYPALSVGWNIAKESFMKNVRGIDELKIRVGFGQTSNQAIAPYATWGTLSTRPYNFGDDDYATGYYVSELPNADLGWEFSKTWNYAVDFSLFHNRLSGTLEYYTTKTNDVLLGVGLPATTGVGSYTANIGATQNKGLEFSLNGVILDNVNGWTWEAGANIYGNRNKLTELASGQLRDEGNGWFVGYPINVIYDYKRIGLWQEGDPNLTDLEPGGNVGMIKVLYTGGYNTDGKPVRQIGADDRQIITVDPKFEGGFNTRVSYKGFDLSIVGAYKHGGILISTLYSSAGYLNMLSGRRGNVKVDYWTPENTGAKYPKPGGSTSSDNPKYGSTLGYFDASYMKIRTISLGYNFMASSWMKKSGIKRLRLYATVQNPFVLFSPYHSETGLDPETNSYGDENSAVSSYQHRLLTQGTNSPATRNYLVGLNLTF